MVVRTTAVMSRALAPYGGSSDSECARTASATDDNPSSRAFPTCLRCQLPLSARRSGAAFCVVPRTQNADSGACQMVYTGQSLSLIHISEPTRLGMISYAVFCL